MSSLFDLPFEDEPDATADRKAEPEVHDRPPTGSDVLTDHPHRQRVDRGHQRPARNRMRTSGLRAKFLCRLWNTGHLYFTLKDRAPS